MAQVFLGFKTSEGIPGRLVGISKLKTGNLTHSAYSTDPSWTESIILLVKLNFILFPVPKAPPDHPVLINQERELFYFILSANIVEYTVGCKDKKAAPKQAEKVGSGSLTPTSVPATLAV